jgi:anhydro-N-acetylmuramic acid kinase
VREQELYVGLMSGTSMDGIDAVVVDFGAPMPEVRAAVHRPFEPALRAELFALQRPGPDELHRMALAANGLADAYAGVIADALRAARVGTAAIRAAGAHGQTVRHRPDAGYTSQLLNASRLAERSGVTVVADFRSRDVAAGGQGAPLVPAFHAALFQDPLEARVVVNIGGIANVTVLPAAAGGMPVTGWDTGPGNVLLDGWCRRHTGEEFDRDGRWATGGRVLPELLESLRADPYFALEPPKSTGRDLFDIDWLLARVPTAAPARDVQATLLRLTTGAIVADVRRRCPRARRVLVCGGGARNGALMTALADDFRGCAAGTEVATLVQRTDEFGVPGDQVEAMAFAWLARQALLGRPGNLPAVTGARGPRVLGGVFPA